MKLVGTIKPGAMAAIGLSLHIAVAAAQVAGAADLRERRVDVDGRQVQIAELGSSKPLVVFVSGLGEDLGSWKAVQPLVAAHTGTLSYDRSGLGRSDPAAGVRTLDVMAVELHRLLEHTGHAPPYVLVGHSLGGALVQQFARTYPRDVGALVLVDPEDQRLLEQLARSLPPEVWAERQAALARAMPGLPDAVRAEMQGMERSPPSATGLRTDLPLVLLTGTKKNPRFPGNPLEQDLKLAIHRSDLAGMSRARHVLVPESRHYIQVDAPAKVVAGILDMVEMVRAAR